MAGQRVEPQQRGVDELERAVADIEQGSENPRGAFRANGVNSLGIGIVKTSTANTLSVAQQAKQLLAEISPDLPQGMQLAVNYDTSSFIEASLHEVELTLIYAALFVIVVIFLFLGSVRATLIPAVTVPISFTPSPVKATVTPSSLAANSTNWRTLYCTPVAMTKSSGLSCCSMSHCIST